MRLSLAQKVTLPLLGFGSQGDALEYLKSLGDWAALWDLQDDSGLVANAYNNVIPVGRQLVANPNFANWTADDPDNWTVFNEDANNFVTEVAGGARMVSDGTQTIRMANDLTLALGKTYDITVVVDSYVSGQIDLREGTTTPNILSLTSADTFTISDYVGTALGPLTFRRLAACDMVISSVVAQQTGILESDNYPGAELLANNGSMLVADYEIINATASNPSPDILRLTYNGSATPIARQVDKFTTGERILIGREFRSGGGTAFPRVSFGASETEDGTTSTDWQPVNAEIVSDNDNIQLFGGNVGSGEYVEFRSMSFKPANPFNGDNDGATPNQPLQPGIVAYSFDSVNDEVVVKSAELNSGITPLAGTMVALFKIGTAVWEDSTIRTLFRIYVDATNYITMKKGANVGEVIASYAGEGAAAVDIAHLTLSPLGTMSMIITFDIVANELKMYLQGTQHGATGAITAVMLGNVTSAVIGSTGAGEYWDELVAHVGFMRRLMTATEIATYTGMLNLESGTAFDAGFDEGFI